jgi:hypothetical protein
MYRIFYTFYANDGSVAKSVDQRFPVILELAEVFSEIAGKLVHDNDFFGLIDDRNTTLQFMYEATADRYWCEIPWPSLQGSYGTRLGFDEFIDLLKSLPATFSLEAFPSFVFEKW